MVDSLIVSKPEILAADAARVRWSRRDGVGTASSKSINIRMLTSYFVHV